MNKNLTKIIQSYVNGDGGYTLSKNYEDRLNDVYIILMKDFPRVISKSTNISNRWRLYLEFANAFKLKFSDVIKVGDLANEFNLEELVREI